MIRLTIIKAPDAGTCAGSDMIFGPGGGTIGRSRSSTWPLIDNDFLVSRTHAEIHADSGQYFVTDKSTNGLFLNNARKPLGFGEATPLRNGDQMHLGHYTLAVVLETPRQAMSAGELGDAGFLGEAPAVVFSPDADPQPIPDEWLNASLFEAAGSSTLIAGSGEDPNSASWFENSLRMMLAPVVGSSVSTIPASDLIALVTQLARTAMSVKAATKGKTDE